MTTLPLTVIAVEPAPGRLYRVTVAFADGTLHHYLVPETLATVQAVTISALAMGMLLDLNTQPVYHHHRGHRRWLPRGA